jgi:hypothetical protein
MYREKREGTEGILNSDELGVEDEEVEKIDENRFLVSTDSEGPEDTTVEDPAYFEPIEEGDGPDADDPLPPLSAIGEQYGVDGAVKAEGTVDSTRIASNNAVETFEELLVWYARQVDESTPPEEVIEILWAESGFGR